MKFVISARHVINNRIIEICELIKDLTLGTVNKRMSDTLCGYVKCQFAGKKNTYKQTKR